MPSFRYTTCVPHETSLHVRGVMAVTLVPFGATSECARLYAHRGQGLTTPAWTSGSTRRARSDTFRSALESFGDRHFRGAQEKTAPGCESSSPLLHGMVQSCSLENGAVWKYTVKKCKQSRSFLALHGTHARHAHPRIICGLSPSHKSQAILLRHRASRLIQGTNVNSTSPHKPPHKYFDY
jgi:hypothetical protein